MELATALTPLGCYFLWLSRRYRRTRSTVVWGRTERLYLFAACIGLVLVGPFKFFFPAATFAAWDAGEAWAWCFVALLMLLMARLVAQSERLSIVAYHVTESDLRETLSKLVTEIDTDACWAGTCLSMPRRHIELVVESTPWSQCALLRATVSPQSLEAWSELAQRLQDTLPQTKKHQRLELFFTGAGLMCLTAAALVVWFL